VTFLEKSAIATEDAPWVIPRGGLAAWARPSFFLGHQATGLGHPRPIGRLVSSQGARKRGGGGPGSGGQTSKGVDAILHRPGAGALNISENGGAVVEFGRGFPGFLGRGAGRRGQVWGGKTGSWGALAGAGQGRPAGGFARVGRGHRNKKWGRRVHGRERGWGVVGVGRKSWDQK